MHRIVTLVGIDKINILMSCFYVDKNEDINELDEPNEEDIDEPLD